MVCQKDFHLFKVTPLETPFFSFRTVILDFRLQIKFRLKFLLRDISRSKDLLGDNCYQFNPLISLKDIITHIKKDLNEYILKKKLLENFLLDEKNFYSFQVVKKIDK